jgi:hypothetical protein
VKEGVAQLQPQRKYETDAQWCSSPVKAATRRWELDSGAGGGSPESKPGQ